MSRSSARRRNLAVIDGLILDLIRDRRVEERDRGDLLSMILASQDGDMGDEGHGRGMTDAQARDEMITLFLAGHETTAIALTWTFYLLAKHPAIEAKLLAELNSVLGASGARLPELGDLDRLPYTRQVFAEAMRLYPPAFATARIAQEDDEFGGVHVKKGESVIVSQWVTHRDSRWWDDPERFDPERFSAAAEAACPKFAYFPFGGGPRPLHRRAIRLDGGNPAAGDHRTPLPSGSRSRLCARDPAAGYAAPARTACPLCCTNASAEPRF